MATNHGIAQLDDDQWLLMFPLDTFAGPKSVIRTETNKIWSILFENKHRTHLPCKKNVRRWEGKNVKFLRDLTRTLQNAFPMNGQNGMNGDTFNNKIKILLVEACYEEGIFEVVGLL